MALLLKSPQAEIGGPATPPSYRDRPAGSPAPGGADQKADAERDADGRERPVRDRVFQRLLDRAVGILRCAHHGAAELRQVVEGRFSVLARLTVAAAGLLGRRIGKGVERVGD